jgi:uncharacterized membrane protein
MSHQPYRTYNEYLRHPEFRKVRSQAMLRSGGLCEQCHAAPPSEVHHRRYPPWGTFDTEDNLLAVCHKCHCGLHGKED